ncbi:MAG: hypothetical protein AAFV43_11180 [Planctomycetota bacterium]
MRMCTPQPNYVIVEEIHSKSGLPAVGNTIGPGLWQVVRRVMQVCDEQDVFYEGNRVAGGVPSSWQYLKELVLPGQQITQRPNGKRNMILAYAGFSNIVQPLPKLGDLLPDSWTRQYDTGTPRFSPFVYGSDPIPQVRLYGNPRAQFVMPGGKPPATAVGIYRGASNQLELPPVAQREKLIKDLVRSASHN